MSLNKNRLLVILRQLSTAKKNNMKYSDYQKRNADLKTAKEKLQKSVLQSKEIVEIFQSDIKRSKKLVSIKKAIKKLGGDTSLQNVADYVVEKKSLKDLSVTIKIRT